MNPPGTNCLRVSAVAMGWFRAWDLAEALQRSSEQARILAPAERHRAPGKGRSPTGGLDQVPSSKAATAFDRRLRGTYSAPGCRVAGAARSGTWNSTGRCVTRLAWYIAASAFFIS